MLNRGRITSFDCVKTGKFSNRKKKYEKALINNKIQLYDNKIP